MRRGDYVSVKFGQWDHEWGTIDSVTRRGNLCVRFTSIRWRNDLLIEVEPTDIDEYREA